MVNNCPTCGRPGATGTSEVAGSDSLVNESEPALVPTSTSAPLVSGSVPRGLWWEVAAVVAVGVVPNLLGAVHSLIHPPPPVPYWLDSLQLVFLSGCTILVTLYLMSRSGESWEHFGVAPVCPIDAPFAFIVLMASILIWRLIPDFGLPEKPLAHDYFPRPRARVDYAMMALKYGFAACAEEIVTRAYLITRLTTLLRSRGEAVLVAAILFASYHVYQGLQGFIDVFVFGVMYGMIFLGIGRVWPLVLAHALYNIRLELMLR